MFHRAMKPRQSAGPRVVHPCRRWAGCGEANLSVIVTSGRRRRRREDYCAGNFSGGTGSAQTEISAGFSPSAC
jgi:hypothetical protein